MRKVNSQTLLSCFSVIASYNPCLPSLLRGIVPKLWNWGCSQKHTVMSPAQSFCSWCWRLLFTGQLRLKSSLLSILWAYHVHKSLYFGFLIWFSYSFNQTTKSLYDLFSDPFVLWSFWYSLVYLLPCLSLWVVFSIYIKPTLFSYCLKVVI